MVSNVLSFRLIILYIFHPLTNVAYSVHLIGLCLSLCYYNTSLICKNTFSIVFNTYTTLSHTTFRKLLFSCVFSRRKKRSFYLLAICYKLLHCQEIAWWSLLLFAHKYKILSSPLYNLIFILLLFASSYKYSPLQLRFTTRHIGRSEEGSFPYIKKLKKLFTQLKSITSQSCVLSTTRTNTHTHTHIYIYMCVCVCVCDIQ